jgi:hypothetical protein
MHSYIYKLLQKYKIKRQYKIKSAFISQNDDHRMSE